MKPNQSQLRRAELYLQDVDNGCNEVKTLRALIKQAKSAPAEVAQGEAVVTTYYPDSRSYEEQVVKLDTKGSRKALGAMNAKLRAKVGRLERELATIKQSLTAQPVAYAAFADNGNIRMWCRSAMDMCELLDDHGNKAVPLYTAPPSPDAELVELLRDLSNQPFIGAKFRKRIDAKLAEVGK